MYLVDSTSNNSIKKNQLPRKWPGKLIDKTVLVVDDELDMAQLIEQTFQLAGSQVHIATGGSDGLHQFYIHQPDLVILDIMMPGIDGWKLCDLIRQTSNVPIIMLSAISREQDVVRSFNTGADDYVTKPFNPDILVARAQAALRRAALPPVAEKSFTYNDEYLKIDILARRVFVKGKAVKLSNREFSLLAYLAQNAGRVLTLQQILEKIWGWEYRAQVDYVHVYMSHLRRKIEKNPKKPQYLLTEHCVGYRFEGCAA